MHTDNYPDLRRINIKTDIHTQNIQFLMIQIYKLSPRFTWKYHNQKSNPCNLRGKQLSKLNRCRIKTYGLNTATFKDGITCNNLPNHFKEAISQLKLIREWAGFPCICTGFPGFC